MVSRSPETNFRETISVTFSRAISSQRNRRYGCNCVEVLPLRSAAFERDYTIWRRCIICCWRSADEVDSDKRTQNARQGPALSRRPHPRRTHQGLPLDGVVETPRRQGNPAQEPEPDLLSD